MADAHVRVSTTRQATLGLALAYQVPRGCEFLDSTWGHLGEVFTERTSGDHSLFQS